MQDKRSEGTTPAYLTTAAGTRWITSLKDKIRNYSVKENPFVVTPFRKLQEVSTCPWSAATQTEKIHDGSGSVSSKPKETCLLSYSLLPVQLNLKRPEGRLHPDVLVLLDNGHNQDRASFLDIPSISQLQSGLLSKEKDYQQQRSFPTAPTSKSSLPSTRGSPNYPSAFLLPTLCIHRFVLFAYEATARCRGHVWPGCCFLIVEGEPGNISHSPGPSIVK